MSTSIKFDKYLFVLTKKNDSSLAISAQTDEGTSIFENNAVDLKKIKFDTIAAALNLQNEKNLLVKIHYEAGKDANTPGQMLLSVIVRYDFLPEFSEDIVLAERKLNEQDSIRVKLTNLEKEVSDLSKQIKAIEDDGVIKYTAPKNTTASKDNEVGELKLHRGKYLLQVSGLHKAVSSAEDLSFQILVNGKETGHLPLVTPYFLSSPYSFPYSMSEILEIDQDDSDVRVVVKSSGSASLNNHLVVVKPVVA